MSIIFAKQISEKEAKASPLNREHRLSINPEQRALNIQCFPFAMTLTPALSHPMGEGEVVPALEQIRGRLVARVYGLNAFTLQLLSGNLFSYCYFL